MNSQQFLSDYIAFIDSLMYEGYANELQTQHPTEFKNQLKEFMENQDVRECLECGEKIFQGRSDKRFCCDPCRNAYNNRRNAPNTALFRNTNNALRRNRNILQQFAAERIAELGELIQRGFKTNIYTHVKKTESGTVYFVYDFGYMNHLPGLVEIVKE